MFRWIILFCLLLGYEVAYAHQPDLSSTMLVEQADNEWVLQVRSALTAFQYEVKYHFGDSAYATPKEFQDLVLELVKENILIKFNDANIRLDSGIVRLGHETNVVFKVSGTPKDIETLFVKNGTFSHVSRNQSALILLKKGFQKEQFILNFKNEHTVKLIATDDKFILDTPQDKTQAYLLIFALIGLALVIAVFSFYKNKSNNDVVFIHSKPLASTN